MLDKTVQSIEETMMSHHFQEGAATENFWIQNCSTKELTPPSNAVAIMKKKDNK
jgi:hypothetical protein